MKDHDGAAPPKRFSVPTRIKLIDNIMLFWPLIGILYTYIMIVLATKGKKKVKSLSGNRDEATSPSSKSEDQSVLKKKRS